MCEIKDGKFVGYGGPNQLARILQEFRKWIENY
jgi:hypothetical protein